MIAAGLALAAVGFGLLTQEGVTSGLAVIVTAATMVGTAILAAATLRRVGAAAEADSQSVRSADHGTNRSIGDHYEG